ncbi:MAG: hypothetical protein QOJ59_3500 [Thermomicrobiales bacterium]|jgi:hypothetical protein|nr:hypothetical protein [Thermomicrobiales bacterium]
MHDDEATPARAWLTVEEAARIAGVHRYSVYKWIRWGWLAPLPADDGRFRVRCGTGPRTTPPRRRPPVPDAALPPLPPMVRGGVIVAASVVLRRIIGF